MNSLLNHHGLNSSETENALVKLSCCGTIRLLDQCNNSSQLTTGVVVYKSTEASWPSVWRDSFEFRFLNNALNLTLSVWLNTKKVPQVDFFYWTNKKHWQACDISALSESETEIFRSGILSCTLRSMCTSSSPLRQLDLPCSHSY